MYVNIDDRFMCVCVYNVSQRKKWKTTTKKQCSNTVSGKAVLTNFSFVVVTSAKRTKFFSTFFFCIVNICAENGLKIQSFNCAGVQTKQMLPLFVVSLFLFYGHFVLIKRLFLIFINGLTYHQSIIAKQKPRCIRLGSISKMHR